MTKHHGQIQFGKTTLNYSIVRKQSRKTVSITVHPDASIVVTAPAGTKAVEISQLVRKKADWIVQKQWQASRFQKYVPRHYVSGESYFYLGRQYLLKVLPDKEYRSDPKIYLRKGRLEVVVPFDWSNRRRDEAVQAALAGWYRDQATRRIPEMLDSISARAGLQPSRLIIKEMKRRWGSCGKDGTLRINWRIMMGAKDLVEYVVAHEVCHLTHKDHSDAFWKQLERIMPDCQSRRERLAQEGGRYEL